VSQPKPAPAGVTSADPIPAEAARPEPIPAEPAPAEAGRPEPIPAEPAPAGAGRGGMSRLVPEVVQTSGMDCGPAALTCLLGGFGIEASYARLRDACQTDVDGTSIDALQDAATLLGLDADQVIVPADHLLLDPAGTLPAIVITSLPGGLTHFVVAWRRHGPLLQIMDPGVGRRWVPARRFLADVYHHSLSIPADVFDAWARSDALRLPLLRRLTALGLSHVDAEAAYERAAAERGGTALANLDAAARQAAAARREFTRGRPPGAGSQMASAPAAAKPAAAGPPAGEDRDTPVEVLPPVGLAATSVGPPSDEQRAAAAGVLSAVVEAGASAGADQGGAAGVLPAVGAIEDRYRFGWPERDGEVALRGAVLVHVSGRHEVGELPADLRAALAGPDPRPGRFLVERVRALGGWRIAAGALAAVLVAGGTVAEAVLFRALLSPGAGGVGPAVAALTGLAVVLLVLGSLLAGQLTGAGRRLEGGLRAALLGRLPRLPDRYVRGRPLSDLAERAQRLHRLRELPAPAVEAVTVITQLLLLPVVIGLVDPASAIPAALTAVASGAVGWALMPVQAERDLRQRQHVGALSRCYLDALLGLAAIRAHRGEPVLRDTHTGLLRHWADAVRGVHRAALAAELAQGVTGLAGVGWLLAGAAGRVTEPATFLLLAYWAVGVPLLAARLGTLARRYPTYRSTTIRLLEPLTAPPDPAPSPPADAATGVGVRLEDVTVQAGGLPVLHVEELDIPAGAAVAVVGRSGSGKSTLAGLLLGWHSPTTGQVLADGAPLDPPALRQQTAWVDPTVTIWNRPLAANLAYAVDAPPPDIADAVGLGEARAALGDQSLGERGWLLPGPVAQRVRLGRMAARSQVRLAVLDEPFQGLDRDSRRALLGQVRTWWPRATLLFVTHDVADTLGFDRVLVVADGQIAEDGLPAALAARPHSRYRALLDSELQATADLAGWHHPQPPPPTSDADSPAAGLAPDADPDAVAPGCPDDSDGPAAGLASDADSDAVAPGRADDGDGPAAGLASDADSDAVAPGRTDDGDGPAAGLAPDADLDAVAPGRTDDADADAVAPGRTDDDGGGGAAPGCTREGEGRAADVAAGGACDGRARSAPSQRRDGEVGAVPERTSSGDAAARSGAGVGP
jgi:ABC-type bacteriocin/lantibiotic exporter with double-glycine peptidase domain